MARRRRRKNKRSRRERLRRGIYVLPNLITTMSLCAGFYSIVCSLRANFYWASVAIMISLLLDALDGRVARAAKATSRFGVEYDSLADLVAFGVAPAVLALQWALGSLGRLGWMVAFLFVACGAMRLARFNVQAGKEGPKNFVGLPIPGAAAMIALTVLFLHRLGMNTPPNAWPILGAMFLLAFLMVSTVPYLSFKEMGLSSVKSFNWLMIGVLVFMLVVVVPVVMGFVLMASYVVLSPLAAGYLARKSAKREETKPVQESVTSA